MEAHPVPVPSSDDRSDGQPMDNDDVIVSAVPVVNSENKKDAGEVALLKLASPAVAAAEEAEATTVNVNELVTTPSSLGQKRKIPPSMESQEEGNNDGVQPLIVCPKEDEGCSDDNSDDDDRDVAATYAENIEDEEGNENNAAEESDNDQDDDLVVDDEEDDQDGDNFAAASSLPAGMKLSWSDDQTEARIRVDGVDATSDLRFCLIGRANVQVRQGRVEILGHVLDSSSSSSSSSRKVSSDKVTICSPFWTSWITVEMDASDFPCEVVVSSLHRYQLNTKDWMPQTRRKRKCPKETTFRIMGPTRPIVLPKSWRDAGDKVVSDFVGSNDVYSDGGLPLLHVAVASRSTFLEEDDDEGNTSEEVFEHDRRICLITGAKGVGKSTLLRYMTNRLLQSDGGGGAVAILDADVGQPELAPPGMLQLAIVRRPLLHPPYWNLSDLEGNMVAEERDRNGNDDISNQNTYDSVASVFFGATTSKVDPLRYLEGVGFLLRQYQSEVHDKNETPIPLLVNCDGWVKGLGYEILTTLVHNVRPTHICQIVGPSRAQSYDLTSILSINLNTNGHGHHQLPRGDEPLHEKHPDLYILEACTAMLGASLCTVPSFAARNFRWAAYFLPGLVNVFDTWDRMSAKDLQTGWIVAKQTAFQNREGPNDDTDAQDDDASICSDDLGDECILAKTLAREHPYAVPMEAIDCFFVDFKHEECTGGTNQKDCVLQAANGSVVGLCTDPKTMESIGLGIVRSIDWKKRMLYVLVPDTALGRFPLSKVKALVVGNLPLPMVLLFQGVHGESFPYYAIVKESPQPILGSEPMKSRNSISRRRTK